MKMRTLATFAVALFLGIVIGISLKIQTINNKLDLINAKLDKIEKEQKEHIRDMDIYVKYGEW